MKTVYILLLAVAALGVAAAVTAVVRSVRTAAKRRSNQARATAACGAAACNRLPIFVMLVAKGTLQTKLALDTLLRVFSSALCPLRVYVGIAEYSDAARVPKNLAERFVAGSKHAAVPFELGDHVRIVRAPEHEFPGLLTAREQLQRYLYHAEKYVLVLTPGVHLVHNWDSVLVQALGAHGARTVVTCHPAEGPAPDVASPPAMGTFIAVASPRPEFASYAMKQPPAQGQLPDTVPALGWSGHLSFSEGPLPLVGAVRGVLHAGDGDGDGDADNDADGDVLLTARLLQLQWTLMHPTTRVATRAFASCRRSGAGSKSAAPPLALAPAVLEYLGVHATGPQTQQVTNRGRLGLVPAHLTTAAEVAVKVGSTSDVLSMLCRLDAKATAHNTRNTLPGHTLPVHPPSTTHATTTATYSRPAPGHGPPGPDVAGTGTGTGTGTRTRAGPESGPGQGHGTGPLLPRRNIAAAW
jgi:hypothetical protein